MTGASDRRLEVLRAIVQDYVDTCEPVGSKALVERHNFPVSPATIRNDMMALEEAGLIRQPHTSAGRVPTDQGYRVFVDAISRYKPLSVPEKRAINQVLSQAVDFDDVAEKTVRLLAQVTQNLAVVQYPSLRRAVLRHLELVPLGQGRLLVVVVTAQGRVEQRLLDLDFPFTAGEVTEIRGRLNETAAGASFALVKPVLLRLPETLPAPLQALGSAVITTLVETLEAETEERVVMAGAANLGREPELLRSIVPLLDALEEQVVLLRLFADMNNEHKQIAVSIGLENGDEALNDVSVVSSGYGREAGGEDRPLARLGVVGPTRMKYSATMAAVDAVAAYLSRFIAQQ